MSGTGLTMYDSCVHLKDKFTDLEDRIRKMETHVTSSRFELQRAFNRISDEGTP